MKRNNGIRDRGQKEQLRLGSKGSVNEAVWQALVLEIIFQICQECRDLVEELVTAQEKEEAAHRVRAPANLGCFSLNRKRRNSGKSVGYSRQAALRWEQGGTSAESWNSLTRRGAHYFVTAQ
jgi:hypothetical protein